MNVPGFLKNENYYRELPHEPLILPLGLHPEESRAESQTGRRPPVFTAARCPSAGKETTQLGIHKQGDTQMSCVRATEHYWALKRKDVPPRVAPQINSEDVVQRMRSWSQTDVILPTCGTEEKETQRDRK